MSYESTDKDEINFLHEELGRHQEHIEKQHNDIIRYELANRRLVDLIRKSGNVDLMLEMEVAVDIFW